MLGKWRSTTRFMFDMGASIHSGPDGATSARVDVCAGRRKAPGKIIMLMADPRLADAERLQGYDYSRVTAGEYRIIFDVENGVLRIVAIGKRNGDEVYRRLG